MMNKSKFTILVVDDEQGILETLKMNFEIDGYHVLTRTNGTEGVEALLTQKIDLIISDIRMKGGDGIFFLEEVRKINPLIPPFILISGFSEIGKIEAIKKGALDLLSKPIDFDILEKYVSEIFSKKSNV